MLSKPIVKPSLVVLLVMLSATPSYASQSEAVQQIMELLNQQSPDQAFALAIANQAELEGDPDFDYAFAVAAKQSGNLDQAVFAFERVLQLQPNAYDARFGLALSYYELGNLDAAKQELSVLQRALGTNSELSDAISTYLTTIDKQQKRREQHWVRHIRFGLGSDSNPNNGVEDEFITIPALGRISLFDESLENQSLYGDLQAQAAYVQPIDQHSSWQLGASILHAEYEDELALNRTFLTTNAGYKTRLNNIDVSGSVFYRPLWLDGDTLLDYYGVMLGASKPIEQRLIAGLSVVISSEDYDEFLGFDRDQLLANAWLQKVTENGLHRLEFQFGQEQASDNQAFLDRDLWGIGYQWRQRIDSNWEYSLSLDYLDSEYQGVHPLFAQTREDSFFSSDIELVYAMSEQWALISRFTYLQNDSEIDIYEYQRVKFWLGASYEF